MMPLLPSIYDLPFSAGSEATLMRRGSSRELDHHIVGMQTHVYGAI